MIVLIVFYYNYIYKLFILVFSMDIQAFYERNCLGGLVDSIDRWNPEVRLGNPIVFSDQFVSNWLGFHYDKGLAFTTEGYPVLCSFNGIAPEKEDNGSGSRVLAFYGEETLFPMVSMMKEIHGKDYEGVVEVLRSCTNLMLVPSQSRDPLKLDGGYMCPYSDFFSLVNAPTEEFAGNINMGFMSSRIRGEFVSRKCLQEYQYVLNVPHNPELFKRLKGAPSSEERAASLKDARDLVVPDQRVVGARVYVSSSRVEANPVIRESDLQHWRDYISQRGLKPEESEITYLGFFSEEDLITALDVDYLK